MSFSKTSILQKNQMKKSILMFSIICLLAVASCKKGDKGADQPKACLLTESTYKESGNDPVTSFYTYDANGKLTNVKHVDSDGDSYTMNYTYSGLEISHEEKHPRGTYIRNYTLDAMGRIVKETYSSGMLLYIYNAEGYLIEIKRSTYFKPMETISKYNYANGNLTSVDFEDNYTVNLTYTNDLAVDNFYSEKEFPINNLLRGYYGRISKNLVAGATQIRKGIVDYSTTYAYKKDAAGNVILATAMGSDGKGYVISSKYNCR